MTDEKTENAPDAKAPPKADHPTNTLDLDDLDKIVGGAGAITAPPPTID